MGPSRARRCWRPARPGRISHHTRRCRPTRGSGRRSRRSAVVRGAAASSTWMRSWRRWRAVCDINSDTIVCRVLRFRGSGKHRTAEPANADDRSRFGMIPTHLDENGVPIKRSSLISNLYVPRHKKGFITMSQSLDTLFSLQGQVAVVTGGTGVLGGAMARGLATAGAKVGVLGRRAEQAAQVVATIEAHGGEAMALAADVLDPAQLQAAGAAVIERWGGVN